MEPSRGVTVCKLFQRKNSKLGIQCLLQKNLQRNELPRLKSMAFFMANELCSDLNRCIIFWNESISDTFVGLWTGSNVLEAIFHFDP
jgi:hypothetical protein